MDLPEEAEGTETPLVLLPSVPFLPFKTGCGPSSQVFCHRRTDMAEQDLSPPLIQIRGRNARRQKGKR